MSLTINTNHAASTASYYLSKNNAALQKSLTRLSSGSRINKPADDAGGLAVSMKLNASINRLKGVNNNIQNAVSFLEVQDGVLEGSASILSRMGELKALSQDVLKNSSDIANYKRGVQEPPGSTVPNVSRDVQRGQPVCYNNYCNWCHVYDIRGNRPTRQHGRRVHN